VLKVPLISNQPTSLLSSSLVTIVVVVMLAVQHLPPDRPVQLMQRTADDLGFLVHYMHIHKVSKYLA